MRVQRVIPVALILTVATALPSVSPAQPTITRGALRGPGEAPAALRGPLPPGATVGATSGALPANGGIGVLPGSGAAAGATRGALRGPASPDAVGPLQGPLPTDAPVGALAAPAPPGARFGEPGPSDLAGRLVDQARIALNDGNGRGAEALLYRAAAIQEEAVGADDPALADTLMENAALLRRFHRDAAAEDMETRAREIRARLETPASSTPPAGEQRGLTNGTLRSLEGAGLITAPGS